MTWRDRIRGRPDPVLVALGALTERVDRLIARCEDMAARLEAVTRPLEAPPEERPRAPSTAPPAHPPRYNAMPWREPFRFPGIDDGGLDVIPEERGR